MHTPIPRNLELLHGTDSVTIRRSWKGPHLIFLTLFCIIWDGILVGIYVAMFNSPDTETVAFLFPLIHASVGVGLTYYTAISYVNKTDVTIDPAYLSVAVHPMPWMGNKRFNTVDIKQLYTAEKVSRNNNSTSISYTVSILFKDDSSEDLVTGLDDKQQALFLEKKIEEVLNIVDAPVLGAV